MKIYPLACLLVSTAVSSIHGFAASATGYFQHPIQPPETSTASHICMSADLSSASHRAHPNAVRFASFNAFLNRFNEGDLMNDLSDPDDQMEDGGADVQIKAVAEIIQRVRPDVLLLNEFDYDENGEALRLFKENYLSVSQNGQPPIHFGHTLMQHPIRVSVRSGLR